jgi:hypothetical protein
MTFGRNEILIGLAVLVVGALLGVPAVVWKSRSSRVQEVEDTVERIRRAEIDHHGQHGVYVAASAAPRAPEDVDPKAIPWTPTDGFRQLRFGPDRAELIGSYRVEATDSDFRVVGTCDADGDGNRAIFEATRDRAAYAVTNAGAY